MHDPRQNAGINHVAPISGSLTTIGILSIVVASITLFLALGGGFIVTVFAAVASVPPTTWTLTPTGSQYGGVVYQDNSADADEVDFMVAGMLNVQSLGDVQEEHLRLILGAHGRGAFPDAQSAQDVTDAIGQAAPDGVGGTHFTLLSGGRFNVDAQGAEWLDPYGARYDSGDLVDTPAAVPQNNFGVNPLMNDELLDAAVSRINDLLPEPMPAEEAQVVRTHLSDPTVMPLGWITDANEIDEHVRSAAREADGALVLELMDGTYTLPAGSRNATYVEGRGRGNGKLAMMGASLAGLGALGAVAGAGLLLAAGIQTLRLRHAAVWLHWLAVAALLVSCAVVVTGCGLLGQSAADPNPWPGLIGGTVATALPLCYALFLIGALRLSALREL